MENRNPRKPLGARLKDRRFAHAFMWPIFSLTLCLIPGVSAQGAKPPEPSPTASKVIILPPVVTVETLSSGGQTAGLEGGLFGTSALGSTSGGHGFKSPPPGSFEAILVNAANARLNGHGYAPLPIESVKDPSASDWLGQLEPLTSRLARGAINDDARNILNHLATLPEGYLIFVQFMEVKKGPGRSWNPNTGGITSAMSSTLVRAALISTRTGTVIWKGEYLERKLFRPDDEKFARVLDQLYSTFANQEGGTR